MTKYNEIIRGRLQAAATTLDEAARAYDTLVMLLGSSERIYHAMKRTDSIIIHEGPLLLPEALVVNEETRSIYRIAIEPVALTREMQQVSRTSNTCQACNTRIDYALFLVSPPAAVMHRLRDNGRDVWRKLIILLEEENGREPGAGRATRTPGGASHPNPRRGEPPHY